MGQPPINSNVNALGQEYWDQRYLSNNTGWDLGSITPAFRQYFGQLSNKEIKILIPGCGNAYEADELLKLGFNHITLIDISPILVSSLKERYSKNPNLTIVLGDFFDHEGQYDLIIEQTFFCALSPSLREKYVCKMHDLLSDGGLLCGLLFDREFDISPPFGGSKKEYISLFEKSFQIITLEKCLESVPPRMGSELFFEFQKV